MTYANNKGADQPAQSELSDLCCSLSRQYNTCICYRCVSLILYLCNFFISHYILPSVLPLLLYGTWCRKYLHGVWLYQFLIIVYLFTLQLPLQWIISHCWSYQWRQSLKISHNRNSVVNWTYPKYNGLCGIAMELFRHVYNCIKIL